MSRQNESAEVIKRLLNVLNLRSERELSLHLGMGPTAITSARSRGSIPYKAAADVAVERGVSLDYLIFGNGEMVSGVGEPVTPYRVEVLPEEIVREVVLQVAQLIDAEGLRIQPAKLADLIVLVCREVQREAPAGQGGNPPVAGDRLLAYLKLAA